LNLRDSGEDIIVALPSKSRSRKAASKDKLPVLAAPDAVAESDIIVFAFPDHLHGREFTTNILQNLKPQAALVFLHGMSVHFGQVVPPKSNDIILLAPLGPGIAVRESYLANDSIGYFYAVHRNGSGKARAILNRLIRALKINKSRLIKTTFRDEAIGDLFGEQAVLCGGLSELIMAGFDTLRKAGLAPDKAYLEVAYQLDLIIDLIKKHGIRGMYERISVAARYGSLKSGPKVVGRTVRKEMLVRLKEIERGKFAKELARLKPDDIKKLNRNISNLTSPEFERAAKKFTPSGKKRRKH
jgi:ketol-acid reductoisomerase